MGKQKLEIFEVFRAYLRVFKIFHEIFMVARSYKVLAEDIKSLLISALVDQERRLKSPDIGHFLIIFKLSVLAGAFDLMIFLLKFSATYLLLRTVKDFVITITITPKIDTTQTRFLKSLAKSVLWSGQVKCRFQFYSSILSVSKR